MKLPPSIALILSVLVGVISTGTRVDAQDADGVDAAVASSMKLLVGEDESAHEAARAELARLVTVVIGRGEDGQRRAVAKSFARALREAQSPRVKLAFLREVERIGKWEVVSTVGGLLNNPEEDDTVREAALKALQANPAVGAKKELRKAATTTTGPLRLGVIKALGSRRDPLSAGVLMAAAREQDPAVQLAALEALADIGEISAVPIAEAALETYEGERLEAARRAYVRYGDSLVRNSERGQARRIYLRAFGLGPEHRAAALVGLARANLQSEIGLIVEATGDENAGVRTAAIRAAALFRAPAMTTALLAQLQKSEDAQQRSVLLSVLADRQDAGAKPGLVDALLAETNPEVQAKAIELLDKSFRDDPAPLRAELVEFLLGQLGSSDPVAAAAEAFLSHSQGEGLSDLLRGQLTQTRARLQAVERVLGERAK